MRSFVVLLFVAFLAMPSVALAKGGGGGGGGGRSSGGGGSSSRPSSSGGGSKSSSSGSSSSSRPSVPRPSGNRPNAPAQRIVPSRPPRVPARVVSRIRPPRGRIPGRDQAFLRQGRNRRYLTPTNRAYYGWPSSPYHYLYLWAFYGNHCDSFFNPDVCPQPPRSGKKKSKCGGGAFLPLPFAGGALAWIKRRKRRKG